jgi:hypothetical protein
LEAIGAALKDNGKVIVTGSMFDPARRKAARKRKR